MPLITVQSPTLTREQKQRIGDLIVEAFHREGIQAGSVVILFKNQDFDLVMDDLFFEGASSQPFVFQLPAEAPVRMEVPRPAAPELKVRAFRTREEQVDLRKQVETLLHHHGALSSFQAQEMLGLKDTDGASAMLRKIFGDLEAQGSIVKQGQKRGTRYVWKGITATPLGSDSLPKLVKRDETSEVEEAPGEDEALTD